MNRTSLIAGCLLALYAISASATDHIVIARIDRTFDPPTLSIGVGDTVTFMNDTAAPGFHNAESDTGSPVQFRCANGCDGDGAGGNGNADSNLWSATVTFPTDATVPYHCEIHGADGGIGMAGTITVGNGGGAPAIGVDPTAIDGTADEGASTIVPLSISNSGTANLDWTADTASTDCATPDTVPWLSLAPTSGTVAPGDPPANVDVTLDATALTPGTYGANVCVHSNDAANDPVVVPVQLTVGVSAADEIFTAGFDP